MLKKGLYVGIGVILTLVVLGVAGFAYAQTQTPPNPNSPFGPGMMGGRGGNGMMGRWADGDDEAYGPLHTYMLDAMAKALGMKTEDLEARLDKGDTMWTIAQEKGLSQEEFIKLMSDARAEALKQAVADGVITQEQADWMSSHMGRMWDGGGDGFGGCMGGGRGPGRGGRWNDQSAPAGPGG